MGAHFLAAPWGLPRGLDDRLAEYLRKEHHGSAVTLLRDALDEVGRRPALLALLAYARYRDAMEVMLEEQLSASSEALTLIDEALALGAPAAELAPLRQEVEDTLAEQTAAELRTFAALPEGDETLAPLEVLDDAAHRLWDAGEHTRAANLFLAASRREEGVAAGLSRVRAGLCLADAGEREQAQPLLEEALAIDWSAPPARASRALLEGAETAMLRFAADAGNRAAFEAGFEEAVQRGRSLKRAFPSVWTHQAPLLTAALELGALECAVEISRRIEEGREQLPRALEQQIHTARERARGEPESGP